MKSKKTIKKLFVPFLITALVCASLCACGGADAGNGNSGSWQDSGISLNSDGAASSGNSQGSGGASPDNSQGSGGLRLLSNRYVESACNTENGYYYFTSDVTRLRDGSYGLHLMYMDFAAGREIYLCSTAGCAHDTLDCPAVYSYDDFPSYTTILFALGDRLYILSREYDNDGTVSTDIVFFGSDGGNSVESQPAALYRANLDGTGREKIYTFDAALTLEDKVFGDDSGIYVVTKKLSSEKEDGQTYTTSSERKLMYLDLSTLSLSEVCPIEFGDHFSWQITDCCRDGFLLCGTDFGRELSRDEIWDDDVYRDLYENSFEVYAFLDRNGGGPREIVRQSNRYYNSAKLLGDTLYISSAGNQDIEAVNILTGDRKTLCALPQNLIMDVMGDTLCCREWNLGENPKWYFVNTGTGEITHSSLVVRCNGWSVDFRGETASDVLFIYDYDATDNGDGSYEIHQYKYALISKKDLFAGKDNYRTIEMGGTEF